MTYLKDIKVCVDCAYYGRHVGENNRCIHPKSTFVNLETGEEVYSYCLSVRSSLRPDDCGTEGKYFVFNEDLHATHEKRRQEFEEAMREFDKQ